MTTQTTRGVMVSVESFYQEQYSNPLENQFLFAYRVRIVNHNDYAIQLKRRHWFITEMDGSRREIEGEGVVGRQPVLTAEQRHEYVSGCNLDSPVGKMHGIYLFERLHSGMEFEVVIPEFVLQAPAILN